MSAVIRRPDSDAAPVATAAPTSSTWTQLHGSCSTASQASRQDASRSPSARSGHAMTLLTPSQSVLLFGGADGKVFFEDVFLLEPSPRERTSSRSTCSDPQRAVDDRLKLQWKRLVVSHTTTSSASPGGSAPDAVTSIATFLHSGGGRDYHTMHYVKRSAERERARGMRVLVVGNVVVASDEAATGKAGCGTQSEGGGVNSGMGFDMLTMRVEELRIRQSMLEAQWEVTRVDIASMWKPKARHAHSSVVVGGEQLFVFGGKDATSTTFYNDIFYYDAPLNQWVEPVTKPSGQLPQPRAFAGLTASDDGRTLFLFGGTDGKQEFGSLYLYDVVHNRWDSLAGATTGDRPSCRINHSLTFVTPHHLVLFGGRRRAVRQNELYVYNVKARTWRRIPDGQYEPQREPHGSTSQTSFSNKVPIGRTAHATVLYKPNSAGPNGVQKLLVFGGYAGSHRWLNDLHLLSLSETVLMQPPVARSSSRPNAATQCSRPPRTALSKRGDATTARVALSAPQQQLCQSPQSSRSSKQPLHPETSLGRQSTVQIVEQVPQSSQSPPRHPKSRQEQQQRPGTDQLPQKRSLQISQQPQTPPKAPKGPVPSSTSPSRVVSKPGTPQQTAAGGGALADITNQPSSNLQQQPLTNSNPTTSTGTGRTDLISPSAVKKSKRRRLADDSQDSNNNSSNSSHGSGELTTAQVGIQTTLLQLLQHQPRVEETLTRILSMLSREQTARQQQSLNHETATRVHSEEQTKRLEAAARRNEALEGRLARAEADRAALHEKLMARETELYMHKHSLEAAIPPLNARVQAIEDSHQQQLTVAQVIESKISAVHDFMDELRSVGGEGTALDDSPLQHQGGFVGNATTQPSPSPPKLLYPQRVVLALEEKLRVMQLEKDALETKLKEMTERAQRAEGRESQARQFFFSWCQGGKPHAESGAAIPPNTSTITADCPSKPGSGSTGANDR